MYVDFDFISNLDGGRLAAVEGLVLWLVVQNHLVKYFRVPAKNLPAIAQDCEK